MGAQEGKLYVISDTHFGKHGDPSKGIMSGCDMNEFINNIDPLNHQLDTVIVAGDIENTFPGVVEHRWEFIEILSKRFLQVFIVLGNHDYHHNGIKETVEMFREKTADMQNVHILARDVYEDENITIMGCTGWCDLTPLIMDVSDNIRGHGLHELIRGPQDLIKLSSDFSKIRDFSKPSRIGMIHSYHLEHLVNMNWIRDNLQRYENKAVSCGRIKDVVLVTHHPMIDTGTSDEVYEKDTSPERRLQNLFFANHYPELYTKYPHLNITHIFGHTHFDCDFKINDNCRIISRPACTLMGNRNEPLEVKNIDM